MHFPQLHILWCKSQLWLNCCYCSTSAMYFNNKLIRRRKWTKTNLVLFQKLLYQIGLSHFGFQNKQRSLLFKPKLILVVLTLLSVKSFLSIFIDNDIYLIIIGDFAYDWKLKKQFNLLMLLSTILPIGTQILHYYYYLRNDSTYLQTLTQMNKNVVNLSPDSIPKSSKWLLIMINSIARLLLPYGFMFICFGSYCLSRTIVEVLLLGLPWSVFYGLFGTFVGHIYLYQIIYFLVLSYDCKLEFRAINDRLRLAVNHINNRFKRETILINTFTKLYKNHQTFEKLDRFWSVYLFYNWIAMSSLLGLYLLLILFGDLGLAITTLFEVIFCSAVEYLAILVYSANIVFCETNDTHKIIASLATKTDLNIKIKFKANPIEFDSHSLTSYLIRRLLA